MAKFMLERGKTIQTSLVSSFLIEAARSAKRAEWEKIHGENTPPTYSMPLVGGGEETFYYDEESIKEADTQEERDAWERYVRRKNELDDLLWKTSVDMWLFEGVNETPPIEWVEKQARWGIAVPEDEVARKIHWIRTELVSGPAELLKLIVHVQTQQDPVEAAAKAAADTFQR